MVSECRQYFDVHSNVQLVNHTWNSAVIQLLYVKQTYSIINNTCFLSYEVLCL